MKKIIVMCLLFTSCVNNKTVKGANSYIIDTLYKKKGDTIFGYSYSQIADLKFKKIAYETQFLSSNSDSIKYSFSGKQITLSFRWPSKNDKDFLRKYYSNKKHFILKRILLSDLKDNFQINLDQAFLNYTDFELYKIDNGVFLIKTFDLNSVGYASNFSIFQIIDFKNNEIYEIFLNPDDCD